MSEEKIFLGRQPEEELARCYLCEEKAIATCARCKMPVCDEHQQETREYVTKVKMILCDECADYYEGLIKPDTGLM